MSSLTSNGLGDPVESEIIAVMRNKDYSLETVNNYGDNLLHMSAANGCYTVIKEILKTHDSRRDIDLQNDCGWTPLMQAIRNGNVETVKLLLENGCSPEHSTFQGISAVALSVAIGREMFELVHGASPSALENTKNDSVSPLCIAAMRNDKELFFRLLELGLKVSEAGDYTLLMMAKSSVPEIAKLGESRNGSQDYYWNEDLSVEHDETISDEDFDIPQMSSTLHCLETSSDSREDVANDRIHEVPSICVSPPRDATKNVTADERGAETWNENFGCEIVGPKSIISPRLEYTRDRTLAMSPNLCFVRRDNGNDSGFGMEFKHRSHKMNRNIIDGTLQSPKTLVQTDNGNKIHKFQMKRPPNLQISQTDDYKKSNETPIEPRYNTPSKEFALDSHQKKMAVLLKRFGLTHFIPIFLEQEIDLDLFLSLSDLDLQEIGFGKKSDRIILQSVIEECNRNKFCM